MTTKMRLLVLLSIFTLIVPFFSVQDKVSAASNCSGIPSLKDPLAIRMENGETIIWENVNPNLLTAKSKYEQLVKAKGWKIVYTSAYRPLEYQQHFYQIIHSPSSACKDSEKKKHGLTGSVSAPNANSPHTKGIAFDAIVYDQKGKPLNGARFVSSTLVPVAKQAGLQFPLPTKDGVHHEIIPIVAKTLVSVNRSSTIKKSSGTPEQLVKVAESYAGSLKWAISVEGTADGRTLPSKYYDGTKQAYNKAVTAVAKLPNSKIKTDLQTRLEKNVNLYISTTPGKIGRAVAYIDAINAGLKIEKMKILLNNKLNAQVMDDTTEQYYHGLTSELKKQSYLLDRVYGESTRALIRGQFKGSAEQVKAKAIYPVSIHMALKQFEASINLDKYNDADQLQAEINKLFIDAKEKEAITTSIYNQLLARFANLQKQLP